MESENREIKNEQGDAHEGENSKRKKRSSQVDLKKTVRVEVPEELTQHVENALETLRERGVEKSISDFVEFYLKASALESIKKWIDLETPMEWRLKAALSDPLKEKLIKKIFGLSSSDDAATLSQMESALFKVEIPKKVRKKKNQPIDDVSRYFNIENTAN